MMSEVEAAAQPDPARSEDRCIGCGGNGIVLDDLCVDCLTLDPGVPPDGAPDGWPLVPDWQEGAR